MIPRWAADGCQLSAGDDMELTALARACGKSDVHHLEPEDLVALTIEASAMARVPLAGTSWTPGSPAGRGPRMNLTGLHVEVGATCRES